MTNEEAIELLKNMHWSITTKMNREVPSSRALNMAIEALKGKDTNIPTKEEVIPMEWIKKKQDELVSNYKYIIDWLILEWEKEQGEIHNGNQ